MKKENAIKVDNLSFRYPQQEHFALENVSFSILEGDFAGLIGPNGSGKTTLIKCILGLLKPTKGSVLIFGKDSHDFKDWDRVGYVAQKLATIDATFPANVFEVVSMGLVFHKHHHQKEHVLRALDQVGMKEFVYKKISELSGGQQQRVLIARALVAEPKILILDEPTAEVDIGAQRKFYELLKLLNKKGITIIMITHDIGIVSEHVNTVICVNKNMLCYGPPKKMIKKIEEIFSEEKIMRHHHD